MENKQHYLVIDDELKANKNDLEDTIRHMGVSRELGLFASNYDDAVEILNSEPNTAICYVDYKIPKSNQHPKANYEDLDKCWGLELIPLINALNNTARIVVYSAYATQEYLQNASGEFKNLVTAFFEKPNGLDKRRKYYLEAINNNSSNLLKYGELDQQTRDFLFDRTIKIQGLIKKTVENMLMTGSYLNEVKQLLQHGQFIDWYKTELGISNASVWRMMSAAKRFENYSLEDLDFLGVAALYELSDSDIPDQAIETIIQDKDLAKSLSLDDAKKLKKHFKTQKKQQEQDIEISSRSLSAASSVPDINSQTTELSSTLSITSDRERRSEVMRSESFRASPASERVHGQAAPMPLRGEPARGRSSFESQETSDPKQDIIQVIRKQRVWRIGDNQQHVIVAAEPNSPDFLRELPPNIALCLAFPLKNWQFQFKHCDTTNIFYSKYQDFDSLLFLKMTDELIKGSTNEDDNVAICYIPEPKILSVVHQLGCHAYVADPDYQKCLDLISIFNQS